jgi:hypothetical protein
LVFNSLDSSRIFLAALAALLGRFFGVAILPSFL